MNHEISSANQLYRAEVCFEKCALALHEGARELKPVEQYYYQRVRHAFSVVNRERCEDSQALASAAEVECKPSKSDGSAECPLQLQ